VTSLGEIVTKAAYRSENSSAENGGMKMAASAMASSNNGNISQQQCISDGVSASSLSAK